MSKLYLKTVFFSAIILFSACTNYEQETITTPSDLIEQDNFTQLLLDVRLAEVIIRQEISNNNGNKSDSITKRYYDFVFEKHNTTSIQFQHSLEYYSKHANLMNEINNALVDSLNVMEDDVRGQ